MTTIPRDEFQAPEFAAIEACAELLDQLEEHKQRQVMAMLAERYGLNLQPAVKPIRSAYRPNPKRARSY